MQSLVRFILSKNVLVNVVFVVFMIAGVWSTFQMPVERYPNVSMGKVFIDTFYPGASPEEVEALVTQEIEDALEDLPNLEYIKSTSHRQRSSVVVKFLDDTDYQEGYDEVRFRVLGILGELPDTVDPPHFNYIDVDDWLPVASLNLVGDRSNQALTLMAEELKIPLRQIPGVKEIKLRGEQVREFHVALDPGRLRETGVTFDQAARALSAAGVAVPAGDFSTPSGEFVIRSDERFRSRQEVLEVIVRTDADGSHISLADLVSEAGLGYRDPIILSSVNGRDSVTLQIIKTRDGNALDIMDEARRVVEDWAPVLARERVAAVFTRDTTDNINDSMTTLGSNMAMGIVLVWLVIWWFMGFRNAAITTVGIPFSFLLTMIIMYATRNSLNEITLFSFVLVSGIIVDDAIVVVENIYRHVQEGRPVRAAVVVGTAEVAWPVISATSTTVAAFLPLLIMTGSTGEFFALVPKAVTFALAASLFECIFIVPLHYIEWGPRRGQAGFDPKQEDYSGENRFLVLARWSVLKLMPWCLRRRFLSLGFLTLGFLTALGIALVSFTGTWPLIKVKFFPDDYSLYYVQVEAPVNWGVNRTSLLLKEIENDVMADGPGMAKSAQGHAGYSVSEDYEPLFGYNQGHVAVTLPRREDRHLADYPVNDPQAHLDWMAGRMAKFARDGVRVTLRAEKDGPPAGKDLNVRVAGSSPQSVEGLAREMETFLRKDPAMAASLGDLADDRGGSHRVWRFKVDREKASEYGLTPAQVLSLASAAVYGRYVGDYLFEDEEVDLRLKIDPEAMTQPSGALDIPLVEIPSGPVRLGDLAEVETYPGKSQLNRFNGERSMTITGNVKPAGELSLPAVVDRVDRLARKLAPKYPGASVSFAGEHESTRKSFSSLAQAFVLAVLLIYLILAGQFGSYAQPLIILSAVSFALIGVILGKFLTQSLFTVNSFVATVGVTGVVVNDALVLVDFLNSSRAAGLTRGEAVRRAVNIRLRPILLTTITTTLGLLPMALGLPYYSIIWGTMATTFVTGLCTATFLTLLLVPVQWDILEGWKERRARRRGGSEEVGQAQDSGDDQVDGHDVVE